MKLTMLGTGNASHVPEVPKDRKSKDSFFRHPSLPAQGSSSRIDDICRKAPLPPLRSFRYPSADCLQADCRDLLSDRIPGMIHPPYWFQGWIISDRHTNIFAIHKQCCCSQTIRGGETFHHLICFNESINNIKENVNAKSPARAGEQITSPGRRPSAPCRQV